MWYKDKLNNNILVQRNLFRWCFPGILCLFLAACSPLGTAEESTPVHTPGGPAMPSSTVSGDPQIVQGDWPSYLLNNGGFNSSESIINPATAPQLKQYWIHHARGAISTQPA